jgi:two-component system, OmpR family, response regulator
MTTGSTLFVLVVEDEPITRMWITSCLEEWGCSVLSAANGKEAVTYLSDGHIVDAVFTDIGLGDGPNGWDVAEEARRARPSVRVVYTSGNVVLPRRDVEESVFVEKPYDPKTVLKAISR